MTTSNTKPTHHTGWPPPTLIALVRPPARPRVGPCTGLSPMLHFSLSQTNASLDLAVGICARRNTVEPLKEVAGVGVGP